MITTILGWVLCGAVFLLAGSIVVWSRKTGRVPARENVWALGAIATVGLSVGTTLLLGTFVVGLVEGILVTGMLLSDLSRARTSDGS